MRETCNGGSVTRGRRRKSKDSRKQENCRTKRDEDEVYETKGRRKKEKVGRARKKRRKEKGER